MKLKVQLIVCDDDGHEETYTDVVVLEKACQRIEHLGLTLTEAKVLLKTLQQHVVERQATAFVASHAQCGHCGTALGIKGYHARTFRTLFGTVTLTSPRLYHCRCQRRKTTTFRPLNALLTESTAPELLFIETKWASLVSYGLTAQALKDFLPLADHVSLGWGRYGAGPSALSEPGGRASARLVPSRDAVDRVAADGQRLAGNHQ